MGVLGGTKNGTWGARIKILRPLFNTNTPLKPPFRHFGNHFGPQKSDFWPFYFFWSFSHWNSHWSRKFLSPWEGVELERKQNMFWNQWSNENNLGTCTIWYQKLFPIRIPLPHHILFTYIEVLHPAELRTLCHSSLSNFPSPFLSALANILATWKVKVKLKTDVKVLHESESLLLQTSATCNVKTGLKMDRKM